MWPPQPLFCACSGCGDLNGKAGGLRLGKRASRHNRFEVARARPSGHLSTWSSLYANLSARCSRGRRTEAKAACHRSHQVRLDSRGHATAAHAMSLHALPCHSGSSRTRPARRSLLLPEARRADVVPAQLDAEHLLHGREHLLVGRGGAALEVGDDGLRGVAARGEVLLRQLEPVALSLARDDLADVGADGLGLDNVLAAVDLGQVLPLDAGSRGLSTARQHREDIAHYRQRPTALPAPNFFSVPMTAPCRCAALSALLPRTTVSRCAAPPPVLLPILVTVSQSSMAAGRWRWRSGEGELSILRAWSRVRGEMDTVTARTELTLRI